MNLSIMRKWVIKIPAVTQEPPDVEGHQPQPSSSEQDWQSWLSEQGHVCVGIAQVEPVFKQLATFPPHQKQSTCLVQSLQLE